jgi:hypothetical protein
VSRILKRRARFRIGQIVRVYGIPEIKEGDKLLGYYKIEAIDLLDGRFYYISQGISFRESRLQRLTKREAGL